MPRFPYLLIIFIFSFSMNLLSKQSDGFHYVIFIPWGRCVCARGWVPEEGAG